MLETGYHFYVYFSLKLLILAEIHVEMPNENILYILYFIKISAFLLQCLQ